MSLGGNEAPLEIRPMKNPKTPRKVLDQVARLGYSHMSVKQDGIRKIRALKLLIKQGLVTASFQASTGMILVEMVWEETNLFHYKSAIIPRI